MSRRTVLKQYALCVLAAAILFFSGSPLNAQRTSRGQFFMNASYINGLFPQRALYTLGGELGMGQYQSNAYWESGVRYNPTTRMMTVGSIVAYGGYMFRIAGTRNRAFSFYGGGRGFIGVDYTTGAAPIDDIVIGGDSSSSASASSVEETGGKTRLLVGIDPRVEIEWFFVRKVAFIASVSVPVKFMTQQQVVAVRASAGFRFNF